MQALIVAWWFPVKVKMHPSGFWEASGFLGRATESRALELSRSTLLESGRPRGLDVDKRL